MGIGLEVFDENGGLLFTTEERITRFLGSIGITGSGALVDIDCMGAELWATFVPKQLTTWSSHRDTYPAIQVAQGSIHWSYPDPTFRVPGMIIYGVF